MSQPQPALPLRKDTILGVCEAIGHDFGFNANFLRVGFAALLLWNPTAVIGTYLALGVLVALSRWIAPDAATVAVPQIAAVSALTERPDADPLSLAA